MKELQVEGLKQTKAGNNHRFYRNYQLVKVLTKAMNHLWT